MGIENKIDNSPSKGEIEFEEVDSFEPVKYMRLNLVGFLENISFNEHYLKCVKEFKANLKQVNMFNLLKEIRNSNNNKKRK